MEQVQDTTNITSDSQNIEIYEVPQLPTQLRKPSSKHLPLISKQSSGIHSASISTPPPPTFSVATAQPTSSSSDLQQPPPPPYYPPVSTLFNMSMAGTDPDGVPIITQVSQNPSVDDSPLPQFHMDLMNETIRVNARGVIIEMTRHELARLPQCILLGISNSMVSGNVNGIVLSDLKGEPPYINFPPGLLQYTIEVFWSVSQSMGSQLMVHDYEPRSHQTLAEEIRTKPAVIVLREDLDFYCLPPNNTISKKDMNKIKRECGKLLVKHNKVLTGLRKSDTPGSPEQHLINMLCSTGFSKDETWGYRELEPNKTVVSSLALVRLRTDSSPQPASDTTTALSSEEQNITTSNKTETTQSSNESDTTLAGEKPSLSASNTSPSDSTNQESSTVLSEISTNTPAIQASTKEAANISSGSKIHSQKTASNKKTNIEDEGDDDEEEDDDDYDTDEGDGMTNMDEAAKALTISDEQHQQTQTQTQSQSQQASSSSSSSSSSTTTTGPTTQSPQTQTEETQTTTPTQHEIDLDKSQKLSLFCKKPARKCWWDTLTLNNVEGCDVPIKVHTRSVWTLEVCIID